MASVLNVVGGPPEGEDPKRKDEPKQSRIRIRWLGFEVEGAGKFLEQRGSMIAVALIVMALVGGVLFAGKEVLSWWTGK